jgi:hypothetical protein
MYANPTLEYQYISDWIAALINTEITPKRFARKLVAHINRYHPIRIRVCQNDTLLDPGDFTIGAEYDPDLDEERKKQFIFNLIINQPKHMPMLITGEFADAFTLELTEALVHELQHQYQYRSRRHMLNRGYTSKHKDITIRATQEYLGCPDEIDAYAANIAARLHILEKLNTSNSVKSLDLVEYQTAFGADHPVVKRLMKKIVKNVTKLKENDNDQAHRRSARRYRNRRL